MWLDIQAGPITLWVLWLAIALASLALIAMGGHKVGQEVSKDNWWKVAGWLAIMAFWGYCVFLFGDQAAHWFSEAWPWGWGW
jgi:hypothetical protein